MIPCLIQRLGRQIHDIDLELLRAHRKGGSVQNWNDRRLELYKVVYQEDGSSHEA